MIAPNRIKTCCTRCGNKIGNNQTGVQLPLFCNDCVPSEFNDFKYISRNKQLMGSANPKTKIPPVIAPPITDLNYWKTNNLVTHSHINSQKEEPLYESGFIVTSTCDSPECVMQDICSCEFEKNGLPFKKQNETNESFKLPYDKSIDIKENLTDDVFRQIQTDLRMSEPHPRKIPTDYRTENRKQSLNRLNGKFENCIPQNINTTCGYNLKNPFLYDTPTNYPTPNCEKSESLKQYNKNLFTQTLQPGVYTKSEINSTPNSNIGISFAQPFEPVSLSKDGNGVLFTRHDPNLISEIIEPNLGCKEEPSIYNVYDPRNNSYGTSYRAYNNELLGQTRFMYDDVDAIRNPNYITRSHVDHLPFAEKYGPMQPCSLQNGNMRHMVNQSFTDSTNQFRAEMQERLMRKTNNIAWQQRKAPISTNGFCAK